MSSRNSPLPRRIESLSVAEAVEQVRGFEPTPAIAHEVSLAPTSSESFVSTAATMLARPQIGAVLVDLRPVT